MKKRISSPGPLYGIADVEALGEENLPVAARTMAEAGIGWIQIRAKKASGSQLCRLVEATCEALRGSEARLWLDDRGDVAALFPVAGVHVGQRDLPPPALRPVVGEALAIGRSTHDRRQVLEAAGDDAVDVVAVGPIYQTSSKRDPDPVVGLSLLRWARRRTDKPLVAIGGIGAETLPEVLDAGADTVALISAVCRGDVAQNCRRLVAAAKGWA